MQSTNDIRAGFLEFFRRNGHEVRPSGALVPLNDPTLMFANAGMNQFKNVFTGAEKLPYVRAATSQKCVRAGGKHNDLDNVGYTARHHTFFEMLGNFSFGDYFKEGAIEFAWNLLTKDFGLNPDKLSFTVYHTDDEAFNLWKRITGCADGKILRIPTKDNFWAMGDTGPCGPCSEIFYDHGVQAGNGEWALNPDGSDRFDARFVEIWNLVFMQYEQVDAATRVDLPKPSIDTGMGLERIAAVMQGVHDNYDIDLFKKLIANIKDNAAKLGAKPAVESAPYKVLADHLRSSCFLIADGVLPSNEGRGYVLRRIMRRAMRYAHQLGCKDPLMYHLVPTLVTEMGGAYPELKRAEATIIDNLKQEEERFKQTLERGLKLLEEEVEHGQVHSMVYDSANIDYPHQRVLPGTVAFKLYDTYGFPLDLTQDILRTKNIIVDTREFERLMEGQREMARAAHKGSGDTATDKIWFAVKEKVGATEFVGYEVDECNAKVVAILDNGQSVQGIKRNSGPGTYEFYVVLDKTPFYGESGGQVGDDGFFYPEGGGVIEIQNTQKPIEDLYVHKAIFTMPTADHLLKVGDKVNAKVNAVRRDMIRANHSATHLLHKALRSKFGDHVTQKGSLVDANRLRFDFSHPKGMTPEEMAEIESNVNAVIRHGGLVDTKEMAPDDAIKAGAMALFGEKYGDKVRVLSMGFPIEMQHRSIEASKITHGETKTIPYSVELCGGTHVRDVADIGLFKITSEGSVASGIRRIEAVTGEKVREYLIEAIFKQHGHLAKAEEENARLLSELSRTAPKGIGQLNVTVLNKATSKELFTTYEQQAQEYSERIRRLQDDNKKLAKDVAEAKKQAALGGQTDVKPEMVGSISFIGKIFDGLDPKELRPLIENYAKQAQVVAVGTNVEGKASIAIAVAKPLCEKISAVTLVQAAVAELGGKGGGGRPEMAQGGGPEAGKLDAALGKVKVLLG